MQTLSFGYKLPETSDKGSVFFPALEFDIQQLNDHNHNGINSAQIDSKSVSVVKQTLASTGWVSQGGGNYRMLVTMPNGMACDDYMVSFKTSAGAVLFLSTERVSELTYYCYSNDSSLTLTAVYTS